MSASVSKRSRTSTAAFARYVPSAASRQPRSFCCISAVLIGFCGSPFGKHSGSNTLKSIKGISVSGTTVSNYLGYLTESFLFSNAKRYDIKGKKYFEYPSKYYCTDVGLRNARLNFRQQEETHIMENIIYNELLCRDYSVDVGVIEISARADGKVSKKQCEIDFIAARGSKKYYIQSALNVSDPGKMDTELRPLKNTKDFFKKIIISKTSMKPWTDDDGILHLGLYEFLLNEGSLDL